jgi:glycosyltransferase involved in cell wall biosynthesis
VPLVTTLHGTSASEIKSNLNQGLNRMLLPKIMFHLYNHYTMAKRMIRESDAVIAISRELVENVPREFGISPDRVKGIYNGIDTERFRPKKSPVNAKYKGMRIVFTASVLHKQKGVQYLIAAFRKVKDNVPDALLLIAGEGPYRKKLEGDAAKAGLSDDVVFLGKIPNIELGDYYNACEVFVIPTVRVEGLPLIELESMACGRPVIASNIGGIPSVIRDGVNGMLVKPGDPEELAEKMIEVLKDRKLASRLGAAARKTIEDDFSRERMVSDTVKAYRGCLD